MEHLNEKEQQQIEELTEKEQSQLKKLEYRLKELESESQKLQKESEVLKERLRKLNDINRYQEEARVEILWEEYEAFATETHTFTEKYLISWVMTRIQLERFVQNHNWYKKSPTLHLLAQQILTQMNDYERQATIDEDRQGSHRSRSLDQLYFYVEMKLKEYQDDAFLASEPQADNLLCQRFLHWILTLLDTQTDDLMTVQVDNLQKALKEAKEKE